MTAWILVSDSSRAKLLSAEVREDDWSVVEEFDHPEGRELSREIAPSSPPGRAQQSHATAGGRSSLSQHTSPKEAEAERFAHRLSKYLEEAIAARRFDYLVLVAPPHFLGLLKGTLGRQAAKHLRTTVDKDLSMLKVAELRQRLVDDVFPLTASSG